MHRLFAGIAIPGDLSEQLSHLSSGLPDVRWVAPENMHITLKFLGEVDTGTAEDIDDALAAIDAPAFELRLTGVGCFQSRNKVRSVWAGVETGPAILHVQSKVEQSLSRIVGNGERRKFTPHVTLARSRRLTTEAVRPYLEQYGGFPSDPFHVGEITLFRSRLGHGGSHYEPVGVYPLAYGSADEFDDGLFDTPDIAAAGMADVHSQPAGPDIVRPGK